MFLLFAFILFALGCGLVVLLYLGYGALSLREPGATFAPYLRGAAYALVGLPLSNVALFIVIALLSAAFFALFPVPPPPADVDPDTVPATFAQGAFGLLSVLLILAWNATTLFFCLERPFRHTSAA